MGYRSDVAVALSKNGAAHLKSKLASMTDNDKRFLFDHPDCHEVDDETGAELWRWNYIKWYEEYPEVDAVTDFLNELEEEDFLFIRVGESYDDIERRGCFWDNAFGLDVETSIVTSR